ncbi:hypothetical protein P3T73_13090 [Kiritimatiellota bacterium B12222]|nr:hypothetical protein P3T73_13090 [Kiritimatiellota bacterium B12222]
MKTLSIFSIILGFIAIAALPAVASPTTMGVLDMEISGHRWGVWVLIDTPSHDYLSEAFRETQWISNDGSNENPQKWYTYWVLGFGPYGAIYLSQTVGFILVIGSVIWVSFTIKRKRSKQNNASKRTASTRSA